MVIDQGFSPNIGAGRAFLSTSAKHGLFRKPRVCLHALGFSLFQAFTLSRVEGVELLKNICYNIVLPLKALK